MELQLKDCGEGSIEIWNIDNLEDFLSKDRKTYMVNGYVPVFEGFTYLGPYAAQDMKDLCNRIKYEDEQNLSPLEVQAQKELSKDAHHKALVVRLKNDVAGILICQWIKCAPLFWRYHVKFIDVRDDCKNRGVGTVLVKALDQADFLQGHILQRGISSDEGRQFIAHVMDRELKGKGYALIPPDYMMKQPPTESGIYDRYGKISQSTQIMIKEPSLFQRFLNVFTQR